MKLTKNSINEVVDDDDSDDKYVEFFILLSKDCYFASLVSFLWCSH